LLYLESLDGESNFQKFITKWLNQHKFGSVD